MNKLINSFAIGAFALLAVSCQMTDRSKAKQHPLNQSNLRHRQGLLWMQEMISPSAFFKKTTVADKKQCGFTLQRLLRTLDAC